MQYKASIPNERSFNCDNEITKVRGKWRELNIYQNVASLLLIPGVIVAFWRGTWDLLDHFDQFFQPVPTFIVSGFSVVALEFIRNSFVSKHLKILDDDTRLTVLKKNILLSVYDILYNLSNVALWRVLWGHPEGEFRLLIVMRIFECQHHNFLSDCHGSHTLELSQTITKSDSWKTFALRLLVERVSEIKV